MSRGQTRDASQQNGSQHQIRLDRCLCCCCFLWKIANFAIVANLSSPPQQCCPPSRTCTTWHHPSDPVDPLKTFLSSLHLIITQPTTIFLYISHTAAVTFKFCMHFTGEREMGWVSVIASVSVALILQLWFLQLWFLHLAFIRSEISERHSKGLNFVKSSRRLLLVSQQITNIVPAAEL